jgi:hypothetical protein
VNAPAKKAKGAMEYTLWKYLTKLGDTDAGDVIVIVMDSKNQLNNEEVNTEL